MQIEFKFKEFEIILCENKRFRLCRDSSRQSKDPGSNPGTFESVFFFSIEGFKIL